MPDHNSIYDDGMPIRCACGWSPWAELEREHSMPSEDEVRKALRDHIAMQRISVPEPFPLPERTDRQLIVRRTAAGGHQYATICALPVPVDDQLPFLAEYGSDGSPIFREWHDYAVTVG